MPILEILRYPHPVLRQVGQPLSVPEIASEPIQALVANMVETMRAFPGTVGLAAQQVGHPVRIFVMDSTAKTTQDRLFVMINPVIEQQSQWKFSREGCLSFPEYLVTVKRARKLTLSWYTPQGTQETQEFRDFEAIIIQHELDHLDGVLFIDRVQNIQTDLIQRSQPTPASS